MTRAPGEASAPTPRQGVVLLIAMTGVAARRTVGNAEYLLEHGVPVMVLTADPIAFHDEGLDPGVPVIDLTRSEAASPLHRGKRQVARLRSLGLPGRAVDAASRATYKVFRPVVLWRAAERELRRHVTVDDLAEIVVGDAHAVPLAWHLARARADLPVSFSLDRSAYGQRQGPLPDSSEL